jgi:hypothetical protein
MLQTFRLFYIELTGYDLNFRPKKQFLWLSCLNKSDLRSEKMGMFGETTNCQFRSNCFSPYQNWGSASDLNSQSEEIPDMAELGLAFVKAQQKVIMSRHGIVDRENRNLSFGECL